MEFEVKIERRSWRCLMGHKGQVLLRRAGGGLLKYSSSSTLFSFFPLRKEKQGAPDVWLYLSNDVSISFVVEDVPHNITQFYA